MTYDPFKADPLEVDTRVLFKHTYKYEGFAIRICASEDRSYFSVAISSFRETLIADMYPPASGCVFQEVVEEAYAKGKEFAERQAQEQWNHVKKCGCYAVN